MWLLPTMSQRELEETFYRSFLSTHRHVAHPFHPSRPVTLMWALCCYSSAVHPSLEVLSKSCLVQWAAFSHLTYSHALPLSVTQVTQRKLLFFLRSCGLSNGLQQGDAVNAPRHLNKFFSGDLEKAQCQQLQTDLGISEMYSSNNIHRETQSSLKLLLRGRIQLQRDDLMAKSRLQL